MAEQMNPLEAAFGHRPASGNNCGGAVSFLAGPDGGFGIQRPGCFRGKNGRNESKSRSVLFPSSFLQKKAKPLLQRKKNNEEV